ncbi:solute carrier family 22 member 9 [Pipistrellus kuhlii]|uniref:Solute carrier family 22 member 9 n=1 Tax=Pipistrellus kuhlii TaxID=59472 RepID=A0A7J7RTS6_PIPKU|nr:solute carrier family 22 member 9 [Pipistrellus kuhlii]KAF6279543.1 solute carrier family 22 member 9 [Pipistrellus kuhlii]
MAFHTLLDQVGGLGRFQLLQVAFLCLTCFLVCPHILLENFTAAAPAHRCWVPALDNRTGNFTGSLAGNFTGSLAGSLAGNLTGHLLRVSVPLDSDRRPEGCRRFRRPQWQLLHPNATGTNASEAATEPCADGWVYDPSTFSSTIVTQWDLVCEAETLRSMAKFSFMAGMLVGGAVFGHLSDRFGRRLILRWCSLALAIAETGAAFAPLLAVYCALRGLAGFCTMGVLNNSSVLIMEWTALRFQALGVTTTIGAASVGQLLLGAVAFAVRDWQTLQLVYSLPLFVLFLSSRWLAESARWLITANRPEEGLRELRKAARMNGRKEAGDALTMEVLRATMQEELEAAQTKPPVSDLFRTPNMRARICLLSCVRFANFMPFFGLSLHLQHLGSNVFLFQGLFGAITLPANYAGLLAMSRLGRRPSQTLFLVLLGSAILAITFVPRDMQTLRVALSTLGVGFSSAAIMCSLAHGNELIPTIVRATASGIVAMAGNIGAAVAPLLMILAAYSPHLPWILYAVSSFVPSLVVLLLPETRNQPLPDSIQDVEKERKGSRKAEEQDAFIKVTKF